MSIACNEIDQTINELLIAFSDCKKIKNSDLILLVNLVAAVRECNEGGPAYNTLELDDYQPITNEIVTYPVDSFHSVNIMVIEGTLTKEIDAATVTFTTGTVFKYNFAGLNQTVIEFTVTAGSHIVVEYLIETI